ncbi:maleylpyruvate isomerase N-terminal domain-containing protein [Celeribacter baekdonensis]|uniref:maleylpyruvate isomerase N-terminal domain-containing protein n=1 Tax=Celeribacter baekdonensis TaxID=875171 RepID=UPI0030DB258B|tara:strand:- start:73878 stop:74447 length:570 start_codon:yes stop_codon:yes gene_type:complete
MALGETDRAARAALKARQGKGARYDAALAPAEDLLMARRGTAYFARKLNELSDVDLDGAALRPGWTRRHVIAHVSYHARHQAMLLEALTKGMAYTPPNDEKHQMPALDLAATLPARALRHLFHHTEVHLNVCWRDLTDAHWDMPLTLPDRAATTVRALPMMRAREVWFGALDLDNGGRRTDLPKDLRQL